MAAETMRITEELIVEDKTGPGLSSADAKVSAFDKTLQNTQSRLRSMSGSRWSMNVGAVDKATSVISTVERGLKSAVGKAWNVIVGIKDTFTAPFRGILNLLKNPLVQAGAILGVSISTKDVLDTYGGFEATMSKVEAISGASASDMADLTALAKEMGATTKFTAEEAAQGLTYMAMAGWKTEDMLGSLSGIMNLAAASGEDLATVSDIVTDAMTAFGLSADGVTASGVSNATHFADVLAAASSNANTTVSGMGETFKYVGSMAGALGYSIEDVALMTGLMANSGIKGTMAGTALNSMLTRLSTNTSGAADAISALGVEFYNSDGSARALSDVMGELRRATINMSAAEKSELANTVAGMEAQKGFLAILNASEDDYNALTDAIYNADGAAQKMSDTMLDNMQGSMTLLQSAVDGVKLSLGERLSPYVRDFADWLTSKMPQVDTVIGQVMDSVDSKIESLRATISEFTSSEEWADADIWGKIGIAWDNIVAQPFSEWWEGTGKPWLTQKVSGFGETLGSGITSGLLALLGFDATDAIADGTSIGEAFIEGFKEGFDGEQIKEALREAIASFKEEHPAVTVGIEVAAGLKGLALLSNAWQGLRSFGSGVGNIFSRIFGRDTTGTATGADSLLRSYTTNTMNVTAGTVIVTGNVASNAASAASSIFRGAASSGTAALPGAAPTLLLPETAGATEAATTAAAGAPGWLAALGNTTLAAGGVAMVGLAGYGVHEELHSRREAGYIGEGHTVEEYQQNVDNLTAAVNELREKADGFIPADIPYDGYVDYAYEYDKAQLALSHAQEELEAAQGSTAASPQVITGVGGAHGAMDIATPKITMGSSPSEYIIGTPGSTLTSTSASMREIEAALSDAADAAERFANITAEDVLGNITGHMGELALTADEIETLARNITDLGDRTASARFTSAITDMHTNFQRLQGYAESMDKINWKVSLGLQLDSSEIEEYQADLDGLLASAQDYLTSAHIEATTAITLLVGEDSNFDFTGLDTVYDDLNTQLAEESKNYRAQMEVILEDRIITPEEMDVIQEAQEHIYEIMEKVSDIELTASLKAMQIKYGGSALDAESFAALQEELQAQVDSLTATYDEALEVGIASLELQLSEGAITQDQYDAQLQALADGYEAKISDLQVQVESFQLDTIADAYATELDGILPDLEGTTSEKLQTAISNALASGVDVATWDAETAAQWLGLESLSAETQTAIAGLVSSMAETLPSTIAEGISGGMEGTDIITTPLTTALTNEAAAFPWQSTLTPFGTIMTTEFPAMIAAQDFSAAGTAADTSVGAALESADLSSTQAGVDSVATNTGSMLNTAFAPGFDVNTTVRVGVTANYTLLNPSATLSVGGTTQTFWASLHAKGGMVNGPELSWVGEDGPEAIIPLGGKYRSRGLELWEQAGDMLGVGSRDSGTAAEMPLEAIQTPAEDDDATTPTTYTTATSGGTSAPEEVQATSINVPVNVQVSPEINIQGTDSMDEKDIVRIMFDNIRDLVDDISDEMADRLAKVFANMPVRGGA